MKYTKKEIVDSIKRVDEFITKNKRVPATIRVSDDNLSLTQYLKLAPFIDAKQRVLDYKRNNKKYANYVTINEYKLPLTSYKELFNIKDTSTNNKNELLTYFEKKAGKKVNTVDEILQICNNKGYGHYYNGKFTNKQTIDRIFAKTGEKPNCTDSCQLVMKMCKDYLGYKVECLHVQCASGEGHVRLRLKHPKHTGNEWIYRDPASVLSTGNNNGIRGQWCYKNYKLLAVNPNWFMNELNK